MEEDSEAGLEDQSLHGERVREQVVAASPAGQRGSEVERGAEEDGNDPDELAGLDEQHGNEYKVEEDSEDKQHETRHSGGLENREYKAEVRCGGLEDIGERHEIECEAGDGALTVQVRDWEAEVQGGLEVGQHEAEVLVDCRDGQWRVEHEAEDDALAVEVGRREQLQCDQGECAGHGVIKVERAGQHEAEVLVCHRDGQRGAECEAEDDTLAV